jgi:AraC family transcriptional regulator, transcriptional activator of pobA
MKKDNALHRFESLTDFHRVFGLPMPLHPMVSLVEITTLQQLPPGFPKSMAMNFYKIAYKTGLCGQAKYGQSHYDFGEGGLVFTAPNQVFESPNGDLPAMGRLLLIHSDFFLSYPLARKIKDYGYFSYAANEALHLSEQEKETVMAIFKILEEELHGRIDGFSQDVMVAQIDLLLNYCNRYYNRQFITRKAANKDLLQKLEAILEGYFNDETAMRQGLPTVQWLAERLHVSAHYLSDMLRSLTGQNAQQHIHQKLIEVAKEKLSTSDLSVSEIAYSLGFEFPQSFSRLFKTKTQLSPLEFRQSFH